MITAKKTNVVANEDGTGFNVTVEFFKDGKPYKSEVVRNIIPLSSIDEWIPTKIQGYENFEAQVASIDSILGDFVPKTPTQDEVKKKAISDKYDELLKAEKELALKVISEEEYSAVLTEYKALIT